MVTFWTYAGESGTTLKDVISIGLETSPDNNKNTSKLKLSNFAFEFNQTYACEWNEWICDWIERKKER